MKRTAAIIYELRCLTASTVLSIVTTALAATMVTTDLAATTKTIDEQQARLNASFFLSQRDPAPTRAGSPYPALLLAHVSRATFNGVPLYYVFNRESGGFVIASGTDCSPTVLGFCDSGTFEEGDLPCGLEVLLGEYERQMDYAARNGQRLQVGIADEDVEVAPLLKSKWGQLTPFNNYCPVVDGSHCPSGCVATALAQVMYYYKWPERGRYSYSYLWNDTISNTSATLSADYANTTYRWEDMLDSYAGTYTEANASAVATLMYHIGVSVRMSYAAHGSGSSADGSSLKRYFRYNSSYQYYYSDERKAQVLINNLIEGRPVYIAGAGHAFLCDGYGVTGTTPYFHINWGWSGAYNGYFVLSSLKPDEAHDYSHAYEFIYDIVPNHAEDDVDIHVDNAGTLAGLIEEKRATEALSLTLSGNLNGDDFKALAKLKNYLERLDMSQVTIVTGGTCTTDDGVLPDSTFLGFKNLQTISLPEGLKAIGMRSFSKTALHDILLPQSLQRIGDYCFYETPLTAVTIPDKVVELGSSAFCFTSLETVHLGTGLQRIGSCCFLRSKLQHIDLPASLVEIGSSAFSSLPLDNTEINFTDKVEFIGDQAFSSLALKTVRLGRGLRYLGRNAFYGNPIELVESRVAYPLNTDNTFFWNNSSTSKVNALLRVPKGMAPYYAVSGEWSRFGTIEEIDGDIPSPPFLMTTNYNSYYTTPLFVYYRWPHQGFGEESYYSSNTPGNYVSYESTVFDWSLVPMCFNDVSDISSDGQYELEKLDCMVRQAEGISNYSTYKLSRIWGLQHHLHVSSQARYRLRRYYSTVEWTEMLCRQIENGHPVIYDCAKLSSGLFSYAPVRGYQFVIDGRNADGLFHTNNGGFNSEAYIDINQLKNPYEGMLTDCYPVEGLTESDLEPVNLIVVTPVVLNGECLSSSVTARGQVRTSFQVALNNGQEGTIQYALGFFDGDRLVACSSAQMLTLSKDKLKDVDCIHTFPATLANGHYTMSIVTRTSDGDSWRRAWECAPNTIPVRVNAGSYEFNVLPCNQPARLHVTTEILSKTSRQRRIYVSAMVIITNVSEAMYSDSISITGTANSNKKLPITLYEGQSVSYNINYYEDRDFDILYRYNGSWVSMLSDDTYAIKGLKEGSPSTTFHGVEIYNVEGVLVKRIGNTDDSATYSNALGSLRRGIYIIRDKNGTRKFAKRK